MKKKESVLPGNSYNKLTILEFSHSDKRGRKWYKTICECQKEKTIMGAAMVSGNTKSCGCFSSKYQSQHRLLPNNLGVKRQIILQYKRHAKDRKIKYDISESDFILLLSLPCHYCGLKPSNIKNSKNYKGFLYSGVDRLDSGFGYSRQNCVSCCSNCNKSKMAMSKTDFLDWIKMVYEFNFK